MTRWLERSAWLTASTATLGPFQDPRASGVQPQGNGEGWLQGPLGYQKVGGPILGHTWRPELDHIIFKLEVNLYENLRGVLTGLNLTVETLDPGLISAYLVIVKITMRETITLHGLGWDDTFQKKSRRTGSQPS